MESIVEHEACSDVHGARHHRKVQAVRFSEAQQLRDLSASVAALTAAVRVLTQRLEALEARREERPVLTIGDRKNGSYPRR